MLWVSYEKILLFREISNIRIPSAMSSLKRTNDMILSEMLFHGITRQYATTTLTALLWARWICCNNEDATTLLLNNIFYLFKKIVISPNGRAVERMKWMVLALSIAINSCSHSLTFFCFGLKRKNSFDFLTHLFVLMNIERLWQFHFFMRISKRMHNYIIHNRPMQECTHIFIF